MVADGRPAATEIAVDRRMAWTTADGSPIEIVAARREAEFAAR